MNTVSVNDPGVPFDNGYQLPDGVVIPALHPRDVEMNSDGDGGDTGIDALRDSVASTVAPRHRAMIDELPMHDLLVMQTAYRKWLREYLAAVGGAIGAAQRSTAKPAASPAPAPAARPASAKNNGEIRTGMMRLSPGEPLHGLLGGATWGAGRSKDAPPVDFKPPIGQPMPSLNGSLNGG